MSFTDIARLKHSDIYDGRIHYERQKTGEEVRSIPLSDALAGLLTALEVQGGEYVLPILGPEHVTEKQKVLRIQKCLKRMNREMKEAAALVGIHTKLTSYVARHTYATTLKRKGTSDTLISEALGHASTNTTRAYLARFGSDVLDATDALL
jgi:integrase